MPDTVQNCDNCGANWPIHWKCQIICPNCGAKLDCSDLFLDYDEIERRRAAPGLVVLTPPPVAPSRPDKT